MTAIDTRAMNSSVASLIEAGGVVQIVKVAGTDYHHLRVVGIETENPIARFSDSEAFLRGYLNPDESGYTQALVWGRSRENEEYEVVAASATPEEQLTALQEKHDALWASLLQQAEERGWCNEYDQFALKHGGPVRTVRQYVDFSLSAPVDMPYTGGDREAVQRAAASLTEDARIGAVSARIRQILGYVSAIDDAQRSAVANHLASYFGVTDAR